MNNNCVYFKLKQNIKNHQTETNEQKSKNHLNRSFNLNQPMEVLVSKLAYVKAADMRKCICLFINLFN